MKNIKYLILSVAALLAMASCQRKETYTPAEKEVGTRYYFTSVEKTVKVTPELKNVSVDIYRTDLVDAKNKISVSDTTAAHVFYSSKDVEVNFDSKENKTTISFAVDMDKLVIGKKYAVVFTVPEAIATAYAASSIKVIVDYPEPWVAFDKPGSFTDGFLFPMVLGVPGGPVDVTVEQNGLFPNRYRIANPYGAILGLYEVKQTELADEYLNFTILKKGDKLNGVDITEDGIVVFDMHNVGYVSSALGEEVAIIHKSDPVISGKRWYAEEQTMATYGLSKVVKWIDEANLVPGIIDFDGFVAGYSNLSGWFASDYAEYTFELVMPDYVILDASVELAFNSIQYDAQYKPSVSFNVALGEDVALAKAALIEGKDFGAALAGIDNNDDAIEVTEGGDFVLPIPADAETGKWSVVVATYTKGDKGLELADAGYVSFHFVKAGEVPDPLSWEYDAADIVDGISKEDLIATSWSLYAAEWDDAANDYGPIQKLGAVSISDFEEVDAEPEVDTVLVKGLSVGAAELYGFDDTMPFEYYEGIIYNLDSEVVSFEMGSTYYVEPEWGFLYQGQHYSDVSAYLVIGGMVSDNILAFAETDEVAGETYDGCLYWSVYSDASASGASYLTDIADIYQPRLVAGDGSAAAPSPAAANRLKAIKKSFCHRTNFVETERAYLHRCIDEHKMPKNIGLGTKQVIESGKVFKKADVGAANR